MKIRELLDTTPKWQHTDPRVRLQAIEKDAPAREILCEIASSDDDTDVRLAALRRVDDEVLLRKLLDDTNEKIKEAAADKIVELIDLADLDSVKAILSRVQDPRFPLKVTMNASRVEVRLEGAKRISDEPTFEQILQAPNHSRVHQYCVEHIEDPARLEQIHKEFLGKDKKVARIAKDYLNSIREQEAANRAFIEQCESICTALEALINEQTGDDYRRRLNLYVDRWQVLTRDQSVHEDIEADFKQLSARFEAARSCCTQALALASSKQQEVTRQAAATVEQLETFLERVAGDVSKLDESDTFLKEVTDNWPAGFNDDPAITEKYYHLTSRLEHIGARYRAWCEIRGELEKLVNEEQADLTSLQRLAGSFQWPEELPTPALLEEARARLDALKKAKADETARHTAEIEHIETQLNEFAEELKKGNSRAATRLQNAIARQLESIRAPKRLHNRYTQLGTELRELKDWQGFATARHREELCERMETLAEDKTIHPAEKARAIKELQNEWKKLGPSDSRENQRLWSRFKAAGDAAFEPCANYFAEQREVRERNLREREKICESLELFLEQNDWENPNWKGVTTIIHEAKSEWHRFRDIPNARRKKIQKRFSHIMDQLDARLEVEQKRNEAIKEELIERVKQLLEEDLPIGQLVSQTKNIQKEWKEVGVTRRSVDQKLWKEFRAQCDLVFSRRDERNSEQRRATDEKLEAAQAVVDRLKALIESDEPIDKSTLNQIEAEFKRTNPKKEGTHLEKTFKGAMKEARSLLDQQVQAGELQMIGELKRKAGICSRLEAGEISQADAEQEWHSDIALAPDLHEHLAARLREAAARKFGAEKLAHNQDLAEYLCIRVEILADLESPPEAQTRRMEYQVERLNRGMSHGERDTRTPLEQLRELQYQWYCLGPVTENEARLRQRFHAAEAVLEGNRRD